ncbi:MAG: glycosyltransferase family 4 protein [Acidobacteriota bacterium]
MKVAYLANRFPRWGGGWTLNEVRGLIEADVDPVLFSFHRPFDEITAQPGIARWSARTTYVPGGHTGACLAAALGCLIRSPSRFARATLLALRLGGRMSHGSHLLEIFFLASRIRRANARHVHAQHGDYVADAAMAAASYLGLPFSFSGHARDLHARPGRLAMKIEAARFVVTCSGFNESFLKEFCLDNGLEPGKIACVHHGVDLERFTGRKGPRRSSSGHRLMTVARLKPKKGILGLVDALALLKSRGMDFTLEVFGDGEARHPIAARVEELGLQSEIKLMGAVAHARLPAALGVADVFVLPCVVEADGNRDGIPNAILEAMASGVPVISTSTSGIPEAVRDGEAGLLVPEGDTAALALAIERMLTDAPLRARCARQGRRIAESSFSIKAGGRALAELFRGAAARGPMTPP